MQPGLTTSTYSAEQTLSRPVVGTGPAGGGRGGEGVMRVGVAAWIVLTFGHSGRSYGWDMIASRQQSLAQLQCCCLTAHNQGDDGADHRHTKAGVHQGHQLL